MLPAQETQAAIWLRNTPSGNRSRLAFLSLTGWPRSVSAERAMKKYGPQRISQVMLSETWDRENMPKAILD
ncbi:MAG: hypothetical protein ACD_75C01855G0002 [uncultured bacterium]|nr:MAG: hypothetical protein ACD_75C01855G0002 [uncultured bacterium]